MYNCFVIWCNLCLQQNEKVAYLQMLKYPDSQENLTQGIHSVGKRFLSFDIQGEPAMPEMILQTFQQSVFQPAKANEFL